MDFVVTFLEGVITFVSPCLLPMVPIYLAYFAGGQEASEGAATSRTLARACAFVLGFTLVFVTLGAFAGSLGSLLVEHQRVLDVLCGLIVVLMGLSYLGVLSLPGLSLPWAGVARPVRGLGGALLFGVVFAVSWSPCVGTFLASALSLAASSSSAGRGVLLLVCYSLGLGLPFVLSALLLSQLKGAFEWVKAHYELINRISGALLVVVGVLMATGQLGAWLRLLTP